MKLQRPSKADGRNKLKWQEEWKQIKLEFGSKLNDPLFPKIADNHYGH